MYIIYIALVHIGGNKQGAGIGGGRRGGGDVFLGHGMDIGIQGQCSQQVDMHPTPPLTSQEKQIANPAEAEADREVGTLGR